MIWNVRKLIRVATVLYGAWRWWQHQQEGKVTR